MSVLLTNQIWLKPEFKLGLSYLLLFCFIILIDSLQEAVAGTVLSSLASPAHILSQQMGLPQAVLAAQAPGIITGPSTMMCGNVSAWC